ncbi:hypothetical protein SDC9_04145 [bioreactor metagenome]|uniref:DUF2190 family protein n=1 Tax=bioreactor metagenome TaxID=1076179 RepID=A0A644SY98_9ZZZZ|nr:DUF2190 family protein [Negativicutes bacterium]
MAKEATFIQGGAVIDYTAAADIVVGQVIPLVSCVGVAQTDITNGAVGAVAITGVYECAAVTTAAFAVGDVLYWDDTNSVLTKTDTSNTKAGICVATKLQAGATARVKIG